MYEVSKCSPQEALRNLDKAFDNFFRKCKLKKGKVGYPQKKTKKKGVGSFKLYGSIHVKDNYIQHNEVEALIAKLMNGNASQFFNL